MSDYSPAPTTSTDPQLFGQSVDRRILAALAIVTVLAIVGPLLVFFATRDGDDVTLETTGLDATALATTGPIAEPPTPIPGSATPGDPASASPAVTVLDSQSPSVFKVTGLTAGSSLNVRQAAGTTSPLIGTLASNATNVAGTGRRVSVDGSEWREIKFNSGTGWVFAGYLAPAPAPAATAAPAATPETVTDLASDTPALYRVIGIAQGSSLNVRAAPGASNRLLGTLPSTTSAIPSTGRRALVGQTEWREISFRSSTGWVNASFLALVPEAPKTVMLQSVGQTTVGIVALTSPNDRLVLRADPGYDKAVVGTVGASTVNVTATGRRAQIGSELWAEISVLGRSGWVPQNLISTGAKAAADVLNTSGVAAVTIDLVRLNEDNSIVLQIGVQAIPVANNTTVISSNGAQTSALEWAKTANSAVSAELTVVGGQVTRIWVA